MRSRLSVFGVAGVVWCACAGGAPEAQTARTGPISCEEHCTAIEEACGPRAPQGECAKYCLEWRASVQDPDSATCRAASSDYFACRQALLIDMCRAGPHDVHRCNAKQQAATDACKKP